MPGVFFPGSRPEEKEMKFFSDEAVVLSTVDYGEADRVVSLLTRGHGKIAAFAMGARKSRKRFQGALDPGAHVEARWSPGRGETMRLDELNVRSIFLGVREDLAKFARSAYCLELCRELVREGEPHVELYDLTLDYLKRLDASLVGPTSLLFFELQVLELSGFRPHFAACTLCNGEVGGAPRFDAAHGGVLCTTCSARSPYGRKVAGELVDALARLQQGEREKMDPELREQARVLLNDFIEHHVGRRLKTVDFMRQISVD
jgi:DNA repair protein RecO (recombination protein O)